MKLAAALSLLLAAAGCSGDGLGGVLPGAWAPIASGGAPTVVFGDRGVVAFPNEASGSRLGPGLILRYELGDDGHLDIIGENASGQTVVQMPGLARRISADQIELCLPDEAMARPATFGGPECTLLARVSSAVGVPAGPLTSGPSPVREGTKRDQLSGVDTQIADRDAAQEVPLGVPHGDIVIDDQSDEIPDGVPHGDIEVEDWDENLYAGPASGGLPRGAGDWLVVLGSFQRANDPGLERLVRRLGSSPVPVYVESSSTIPKFRPGLTVVVAGPYRTQSEARGQEQALKRIVPDAYRKEGW